MFSSDLAFQTRISHCRTQRSTQQYADTSPLILLFPLTSEYLEYIIKASDSLGVTFEAVRFVVHTAKHLMILCQAVMAEQH